MAMERRRPRWGLVPWRTFREMEDMERRFDEIFGRPTLPSLWWRLPEEMSWVPALDVFEKENKLVVKAEIPGMKEEDIDVSVVDNTLTIKGERNAETEVKDEDYYRCERSYGSFFRSVPLPSAVDASKIEANYEDGVLEVTLPKTAAAKRKKVKVAAKKKAGK
jgi:HSP20 family protein